MVRSGEPGTHAADGQGLLRTASGSYLYFGYTTLVDVAVVDRPELKIDSQVGTIEPGKIANLLLLEKSPLTTIDAYDSIVTVSVHGKAVPRESLAAK